MPHPDMSESWVNGHPDEGLLHEWLDEQLSADNAAAVELHVAECDACSALVAEARGLIAASHRILSALDDVPANVSPVQSPAAESDNVVVELAAARDAMRGRKEVQLKRSKFRWQNFGKVAALLLVAFVPGVMFLRGDDVTVPFERAKTEAVADSSAVATSPAVPIAQPVTPVDSARARALPLAASTTVAMQKSVGNAVPSSTARVRSDVASDAASNAPGSRAGNLREPQKTTASEAERAPLPPAQVNRAEADRLMATVPPLSDSAQARGLDRLTQAQREQALGAALSGKVAGVAIPSRGQGVSGISSRTTQATPAPPATPVPQISNAPAPTMLAGRPPARVDTAVLARELMENARRSINTAGDSTSRSSIQLRGFSAESRSRTPRATFDSVTLTRTICATACETAALHLSNLGAVRYSVSSGSTRKPIITSQLSATDHIRIEEVLAASITQSVTLAGALRCTIRRTTGAPELEVMIANGARGQARAEIRCATSEDVLRRLGASIDSIVGTDALRRRIP